MTSWALVTGASSGIGLEFSRILAREGYSLVIAARRLDRLRELATDLEQQYDAEVEVIESDLSSCEGAWELYRSVRQREIVPGVLINNAGIGDLGEFAEMDIKRLVSMLEVNCVSLACVTRLFLPEMIARGGGRILNVSSAAAFQPGPYMAAYYASKAFVQSLSEALSEELAERGVTVTALCPGPTRSEFQEAARMNTAKYFSKPGIPTAQEVAEYGYRTMLKGKRVAIHGFRFKLLLLLTRFLPRRTVVSAVSRLQQSRR
ncbi:MAG: SDR family NAD(P)-dependent oxidoreductase [Spirochaetaceae bacterium]